MRHRKLAMHLRDEARSRQPRHGTSQQSRTPRTNDAPPHLGLRGRTREASQEYKSRGDGLQLCLKGEALSKTDCYVLHLPTALCLHGRRDGTCVRACDSSALDKKSKQIVDRREHQVFFWGDQHTPPFSASTTNESVGKYGASPTSMMTSPSTLVRQCPTGI